MKIYIMEILNCSVHYNVTEWSYYHVNWKRQTHIWNFSQKVKGNNYDAAELILDTLISLFSNCYELLCFLKIIKIKYSSTL